MINPMSFIKSFFGWITGRTKLLPVELIGFRYATCRSCPSYRRGKLRQYCGECKCTLSEKRHPFQKLAYPEQECPRGYWQKVSID